MAIVRSTLKYLQYRVSSFFNELINFDLFDFNRFIFEKIMFQIFCTKNILPFIVGTCIIGFSIITEQSRYIFIPQTSVGAYASFFVFTLIVSIITLIIYPLLIIIIINLITAQIKKPTLWRHIVKVTAQLIAFIAGVIFFTYNSISAWEQIQIITIWIGLYFVLASMYIAHKRHNNLLKLSKLKYLFVVIISIMMAQPLMMIDLHTSEVLNYTNVNPQVYLTASNCALLHNLDERSAIEDNNNILFNKDYYRELPNNQGCYIYGNIIRYSFGYDFVLLVKKNIHPIYNHHHEEYNEYVRLNCFAGNCYSENHIFFKRSNDYYEKFIEDGQKLDYPL